MNKVTPTDIINHSNIENAFSGYFTGFKYTNTKITDITGIPFGKKQKEVRTERKLIKSAEHEQMIVILEKEYSINPKLGLRNLSEILKLNGIKRGKTFLSVNPDVVAIRNKYLEML